MDDRNQKIDWDTDESLDLRNLWNVVDRRKWQIGMFALAMSILASIVVVFMTPVYRATATVLIESQKANVVSIEEVYGLDMGNQQYYETQFAILDSRPIAEAVVDRLNLETRVETPTLDEDAGLPSRFLYSIRSGLRGMLNGPADDAEARTHESRQKLLKAYSEKLDVEPVDKTQLVNIHYNSPNRDLAADVANAHAQAYIENILDSRLQVTQTASNWMARRVEDLKLKLETAESRLQEYREQESLIDAEGVQSLPTQEINELTSRLVEARRRLSDARIAYSQIRDADRSLVEGSLDGVPAILRNTAVQNFREAEAEAERKVAELAKRYGPLHPKMQAAQSELQQATRNFRRQQTNVAQSMEADLRAAQSDVSQLERELEAAKGSFQQVGRKQSELSALQREVDVNRDLYEMFYNRMRETAQTGDLESVNARIVSPAVVPALPESPKKQAIVALVFAASILFGIVAAFLDESLNNTLRSSQDVEDKLELPMLGMLPLMETEQARDRSSQPAFFRPDAGDFREATQTVRTSLTFVNLDRPSKVMLIASSVSGEGKSTVAVNLACAFAQMENTLLIDGDLRRPTVGEATGLQRTHQGLSDILLGKAEFRRCISTRESLGVDVLPAGILPPNPLELLSSSRFAELIAVLRNEYDRIIIDSPPVLPVSDSIVMARYCDSVGLVVKADSTAVHQVRQCIQRLDRAQAPIAGIVLNQLDLSKANRYSDYGYGGYHESYGADETANVPRPGSQRSLKDSESISSKQQAENTATAIEARKRVV